MWQLVRNAVRADVEAIADWPDEAGRWDGHELLLRYFTWAHRVPPARPRTVHDAPGLDTAAAQLAPQRAAGLARIRDDLAAGGDLAPYVTERVSRFGMTSHARTPLPYRDELDTMLFGWGVHHLHLSAVRKRKDPRFVARADELLLVMLTETDAYLLGIDQHASAFERFDLVDHAVTAWPDAGLRPKLFGAVGLERELSPQEHARLRDAGVATMSSTGGGVFAQAAMITTAGTPMLATELADGVARVIDQVDAEGGLVVSRQGTGTSTVGVVVPLAAMSVTAHRGEIEIATPLGATVLGRAPAEIVPDRRRAPSLD